MKTLIVNNMMAGSADGAIYDFIRHLSEQDCEVVLRNLGPENSTEKVLEDAENFDLVVASGGDGTVASVTYALRNTGIPILPFPSGTSNALVLNLMSPTEVFALANLAKEGQTLDFDLAELTCEGRTYGFELVAGCGYDATIMSKAKELKGALGSLAYFHAAVTNPLPTHSHLRITLDNDEVIERDGVGVLVANFSKLQFELPMTQENLPRDGMLDVIILETNNAVELIPGWITSMMDKEGSNNGKNGLEYLKAKEVTVEAEPPLPVQFDGEPLSAQTPFTAKILPGAVNFVVCDEAVAAYAGE